MFKLRQKNFTLIELIVVILILGVLMRIAIPKFAETKHDFTYKADSVSAQSIIRQLESKVLMGMIDLENNKTVTIYSNGTTSPTRGGENLFGEPLPKPQIKVDGGELLFKVTLIRGKTTKPNLLNKTFLEDYTTSMDINGEHHWAIVEYVFKGEEDTKIPNATFAALENGRLVAVDIKSEIQ